MERRWYDRQIQPIAAGTARFTARACLDSALLRAVEQAADRRQRHQSRDATSVRSEALRGFLSRAFRNARHQQAGDNRAQSSNWEWAAILRTCFRTLLAKHQSHLFGGRQF